MEPLLPIAITLPPTGSRARLAELHQQLRAAILDGRLQPGLRLPSTRSLAAAQTVSRNTVITAYELLLSEGYLRARRGSGTVVAKSLPALAHRRAAKRGSAQRLLRPLIDLSALEARKPEPPQSFRIGLPDLTRFPFALWQRLSARAVSRLRDGGLMDRDPQGLHGLRAAIARHVSYARAVACRADDIVVTAGAQQAFDLLARVLQPDNRGTVAVEEPGYPLLRAAWAAQRAGIDPVAVDDEGILVERIPARARVVCVTPSHQFPLGIVLSLERRTQLLDWARKHRGVVIEDDYDGEFRFTDRPLDALQTLDRHESVFYVGTFSKCLLPDLRLGYIVAPPWARAALIAAKRVSDGWSSVVAQTTLASFINDGHLTRHIRKMQRLYDRRRMLLLAYLNAAPSRWLTPLPSVAGLHMTVFLDKSMREAALVERLHEAGVGLTGLSPFYAGRHKREGLLFGLGHIDDAAIAPALTVLHRVLAQTAGR